MSVGVATDQKQTNKLKYVKRYSFYI